MGIALPHGFITPFAELVSDFGGLMEQCLEEAFPACFDAVIEQWKRTVKNWVTFHNHFTKDNITLILSCGKHIWHSWWRAAFLMQKSQSRIIFPSEG